MIICPAPVVSNVTDFGANNTSMDGGPTNLKSLPKEHPPGPDGAYKGIVRTGYSVVKQMRNVIDADHRKPYALSWQISLYCFAPCGNPDEGEPIGPALDLTGRPWGAFPITTSPHAGTVGTFVGTLSQRKHSFSSNW
jgi:hypothetical protein